MWFWRIIEFLVHIKRVGYDVGTLVGYSVGDEASTYLTFRWEPAKPTLRQDFWDIGEACHLMLSANRRNLMVESRSIYAPLCRVRCNLTLQEMMGVRLKIGEHLFEAALRCLKHEMG